MPLRHLVEKDMHEMMIHHIQIIFVDNILDHVCFPALCDFVNCSLYMVVLSDIDENAILLLSFY